MYEIRLILCPTDFSGPSRHAMDVAIALARQYAARIVALHVHTPIFIAVPQLEMAGYPSTPAPPHEIDLVGLHDDVDVALRPARSAGIATDAIVRIGPVAREIVDCARALPADLIVMGTHGTGGFEHLMLGSVTEKVLRQARCPVLTVPPRSGVVRAAPFTRIVCPVDLSDVSPAIVEFAASLARASDAELILAHVLEWPSDEEPRSTLAFNVPEYRRYREADVAARLKRLIADAAGEECRCETRIVHGKPYRQILAIAESSGADLIVMGVRGHEALERMLFGSTTNHVVRRATCPVLTLRQ